MPSKKIKKSKARRVKVPKIGNKPQPGAISSFFGRLCQVWCAKDRPKWTRTTIVAKVLSHVVVTYLYIWQSKLKGQMMDACSSGDYDSFTNALAMYALHLCIFAVQRIFNIYLIHAMEIKWRRYLTDRLLDRYFVHKNFYHANSKKDLDNPGMRITDDVAMFTHEGCYFYNEYTGCLVMFVSYPYELYKIDPTLLWIFPYCFFCAALIYVIWSKKYAIAVAKKSKDTAVLRTGLVQTSEYSESVAFLGAEDYEYGSANRRYDKLEKNLWNIAVYASTSESAFRMVQFIARAMPYILLAHRYFAKENRLTQVGLITEAWGYMCDLVELSLKIVDTDAYEKLNNLAGSALRVDELDYELDRMDRDYIIAQHKRASLCEQEKSVRRGSNGLTFQNVSLSTPGDYTQKLVQGLNMSVEPGASVIIVGPSGVGKSSLMRAICGLWQPDKGCIRIPEHIEPMFLPQSPYIPDIPIKENTLRSQMLFPKTACDVDDDDLLKILQRVNLQHLIEEDEGLDTTCDWRARLSGGEKQRLAMARLLVVKPQMAFLDEATSALDSANERRLYHEMQKRNATYISIGHKEELYKFHKYVLELKPNGAWDFRESTQFKME